MLRLKTSKFIFLLGALLLASLNSCGGKREKKKENSLTVLSAAIGDLNSVLPGGLMIYAHEASKDLAYTYHAYNGHSTLELENGTWTFWAVGWKGGSKMTGPVRCGKTSMNLEGGDGTLALLMNDSRCDDVDFAASIYRASSQFKALRITSCNSLASVTAGTDNCSGVVGPAGSYKIKLPQLDGPDSTASNATSTGLEVCIADGATGNGDTSTSLLLPTGGSGIATSLFTTIIEVHTNSTCTALGDSYTFANGIASAVTNQSASDVKIFSDTTEASLYLKPSSVSVTQPTVTLTTTESSFHNSSPYTVSASFSENVSGVALGDFTVVSGSAGNLVQYTSASYSVDITPTAGPATSVTVTFNAGGALAISDSDPNLVSNSLINTYDNVAPTASSVSIYSNNSTSTLAKVGDIVTLSFTLSETLTGSPTVTIDGNSATIGGTHPTYTATYTLQAGDTEGVLGFTLDFTDAAGNAATQVTAVTDGTSVVFDETAPTASFVGILSNNLNTSRAKVGDVVTVSFTVNEALTGSPTVTIDGNAATIGGTHPNYQATYTMQSGDTEASLGFTLDFTDAVGNSATQVTAVTNASSVTFDEAAPSTTFRSIVSNNATTTMARVGDVVTLSFTVNEALLGSPTVTIDGNATSIANAHPNYQATYTMQAGDTEGVLSFTLDFTDASGNAGTQQTTVTDGSSVTFDETAPTASPVTIASNNTNTTLSKVGDNIVLTFTVSETLNANPVVNIDGNSATIGGTAPNYTATYTMQAGDTEGSLSFTLDFTDAAGNAGTQVTATTDASSVVFDETIPTVSIGAPTASSFITTSNESSYTVSGTCSENGQEVTIDVGGETPTQPTCSAGSFSVAFDVSGASDGAISVTADHTDAAGNSATQASVASVTKDTTQPSVSTINRTNTSPTNGNSVDFTVTFSESVATVVAGDFSVSLSGSGSPSVSGVAGTGATRTVTVDTTSTDGTVGLDLADLNSTIQDAAGNVLSSNTHTSDETYTVDQTNPTASPVTISSNNSDTTKAKVGDIVTVSFTVNEALLGSPTVTIDGNAATISGGPLVWTGSYTMQAGDTEGTLGFTVDFQDSAGNSASQITATTDASAVVFDETIPTASPVTIASNNSFNTDAAKVGDIVTLNFTVSETLLANPVVTIDGNAATIGGTAPNYNATYTMQAGDSEGILTFTIDFNDLAGNSSTQITATTDVSTVTFDETNPTVPTLGTGNGYYGAAFNTSFTASTDTNFNEYRYRLDGTDPTDCSNGTGTPGATVNIPVKTTNNTTQDLRVIACDDAGNQSTSVSRTYTWLEPTTANFYTNAPDWNDWLLESARGTAGAAACSTGECFHGGQVLIVDVPELTSCGGMTATDNQSAFTWDCDDSGANVIFTNHKGFATNKGLADLVNAASWKSLTVDITGGSLISDVSSLATASLWSNSVAALPGSTTAGSRVSLSVPDRIYTHTSTDLIDASYEITADGVGVVNLGGAGSFIRTANSFTANDINDTDITSAANSSALLVSKGRKYLWIESNFNADSPDTSQTTENGVYLHTTQYSTIHNSYIFDTLNWGLRFRDSDYNYVFNLESEGHYDTATNATSTTGASIRLELGSDNNKFYKFSAYDSFAPIWIDNGANNKFKSFHVAYGNENGIYIGTGNGNNFQDGSVASTFDTTFGQGLYAVGVNDTTVVGVSFMNNDLNVNIESSSGAIMINTTIANGRDVADGGLLLDGSSTNNSFLRTVSINNQSGINYTYGGSNTNNAQWDLSTASNVFGIDINGAGAHQDPFMGVLDFESNSSTDCSVSGGTKGINSSCSPTGTSSFTYTASSGLTSASSFVGGGTTASFATINGTDTWVDSLSFYQGWGQNGTGFGNKAPCTTGTCAKYDWSLQSSDSVLRNKFTAPSGTNSGTDNITHIYSGTGSQSLLRYATEVNPLDYYTTSGDQDGICEDGEVCVYSPNFGAYQGHGSLIDTPTDITAGSPFSNIKILRWDTNGY